MPDSPLFEKPVFTEPDIEKIKTEVKKFESSPEAQSISRHEMVKQSIQNIVEPDDEEDDILPEYAKDAPEEEKDAAEALVRVAIKDGLAKANKIAKSANPSVMDMFHDALTKHYLELEEKGII